MIAEDYQQLVFSAGQSRKSAFRTLFVQSDAYQSQKTPQTDETVTFDWRQSQNLKTRKELIHRSTTAMI
jgi:hypothetical protein